MKYDFWYFDKNFLRFLQLFVYSLKNQRINVINDHKQAKDIVVNGLHLGECAPDERNTLTRTINVHYKGLSNIRSIPLWRSHVDMALAVFNNR